MKKIKPQKTAESTTPMDAALKYLASKMRTVREMENHLDSLNYGEYEVYAVVERLKELGYLDDEKFAAEFVRSRLASKPLSKRKLNEQLYSHNIEKASIEAALAEITPEQEQSNALEVAQKFARQFESLPKDEQIQRTSRRLAGRGFSYEDIRFAMEKVFGENLDELDLTETDE